jgi:drug resistance transporter, EmrB/QacA subfamily
MNRQIRPWPALWALVIGFFMILIDTTIVSVANPKIMAGLNTDIDSVIWVTSAYLLAYAVPLLITGRLGDRFGPKNIYLIGLVIFTLSSAWCGFAGSIELLITARVFQGLGAAMMTPQTMAVITRIFPPQNRGQAMGLWGATAGVATLVGPILGGVLVDAFGWEWIFFINVPVGVVAFTFAWRLVPHLETHSHRFDILGVVLSAVGMFLLVFGIQEGQTYDWGVITGPITVWGLIIAGIVVLVLFVVWQALNKKEPLLPLGLFTDRNFAIANLVITTVGFTITSMAVPLIYFIQLVYGFTPTQSALMLVPMAVLSGVLAPFVGRLVDRINPRYIAFTGMLLLAAGLFWYSSWLDTDVNTWPRLLLPSAVLGLANACIWSPLSTTATHNLPPSQAGAGAGVYNTTRQIGAVLGSASIAALMTARITADLPTVPGATTSGAAKFGGSLPAFLHADFTTAMSQTMLLPAFVALLGAVVVLFIAKPTQNTSWQQSARAGAAPATERGAHAAPVAPAQVPIAAAGHETHGAHAAPAESAAPAEFAAPAEESRTRTD